MSISHKSSNVQIFRLMAYRRALHPELFNLQCRRMYRHGEYEAEGWILPSGHVVRFQIGDDTMTEVVVENGDHLPEHGLVHALPCVGEKEYEWDSDESRLEYVTTLQTEALTDNLYQATFREMHDFALETGSQHHEWSGGDGAASLSVLDTQMYRKEFHIQSYHLLGNSAVVLRTQSILKVC